MDLGLNLLFLYVPQYKTFFFFFKKRAVSKNSKEKYVS